jgi:predicted permease
LRRRRLESELDEELRFHLAKRTERYLSEGLDAGAARSTAMRRFGNALSLKEECRDMWTFAAVETLAQDARCALRALAKNPAFTAVAALSLALGIGANAAIFSFVNAMLLRPLPYPGAERLLRLTGFYPKGALVAMREQSRTLEVAGAGSEQELSMTANGEATRVVGSQVSANLFAVLGRGAALGRAFAAGDDRPGRDRIVVLSQSLWRNRFQADPALIGRMVTIEGVARQVVGVMPQGFHFPSGAVQLWTPLALDPSRTEDYWGFGWMPLVARLRSNATLPQAQDELRAMIARIRTLFPWPSPNWNADAVVVPLQQDLVRDVRRKLLLLQSAVGIVLLVACANVASLLLSRAAVRRKEIALRTALGASRGRILRQLLAESLALALLGGGLGVGLAAGALSGLRAVLPADTRGFAAAELDGGVLAFVSALSLLSGLAFGLAPAVHASRADLAGAMKAGGRQSGPAGRAPLRSSFIAAEVALAVVLAVGAGLLIRTLWGLTRADAGFRTDRTLAVRVFPNPATCQERAGCVALYDELLRRVSGLNAVGAAAVANALPLSGQQPLLPVEMEGHALLPSDPRAPLVWAGAITPRYFRVLGIPLLEGRGFDEGDSERSARVVVVSAETARRYWPGENPVGKRIRVVWDRDWRTVVGVVGDVRQYALSGRVPSDITGAIYMPYPQAVGLDREIPRAMAVVVRTTAESPELLARLRSLVASVNSDAPVSDALRFDALVASSVDEPRSLTWIFAAFSACALLLAAIGTYGVVAYATAQRRYEIGVRVALGATRRSIFGLVIGHSLKLVVIGLALGVAASLLLGRALQTFLYGVTSRDPATFGAVTVLLLMTGLLAGYLPARRAAAIDPARTLRAD